MCERHVVKIKLFNVHTHTHTRAKRETNTKMTQRGSIKQYSMHAMHMIFVGISPCECNFSFKVFYIQMVFACMIRLFPLSECLCACVRSHACACMYGVGKNRDCSPDVIACHNK